MMTVTIIIITIIITIIMIKITTKMEAGGGWVRDTIIDRVIRAINNTTNPLPQLPTPESYINHLYTVKKKKKI